jgi:hypothetical protein
MQHSVSVSVKDISFESFLGNLMVTGIYCELQKDRSVGGGEGNSCQVNVAGMASLISNGIYDLQCFTIYSVQCA